MPDETIRFLSGALTMLAGIGLGWWIRSAAKGDE